MQSYFKSNYYTSTYSSFGVFKIESRNEPSPSVKPVIKLGSNGKIFCER